jgi:type I restriction enzyme S subunit
MNAIQQLLTDHIDIWTGANTAKRSGRGRSSGSAASVYGIKKLRELILELAVRGKLVPQAANDEPASELLKRIQAEKANLITEGKEKRVKPLPSITEEESLFTLPTGWLWVRLDDIGNTFIGLTYSPKDISNNGTPVLRSSNIKNGKIDLIDLVRVDGNIKSSLFVNEGDLLICARNGSKSLVGKTAMIKSLNEPMVFGAFMAIYKSKLNFYIEVFLNSPIFRSFLDGVETTTINQITQNNLKTTLVPLPPLAEQHRIVAKVDELMALCDQLEAQHNNAAEAHEKLVSHLLGTLTQSQNAEDFSANWQRISTHFDVLFTTEASIDDLKQTLLQLAVMGKLVPQDPHDEPASELLKRIQAEKTKLIAEGKIKKEKPLAPIGEDEKPFELPIGWEYSKLGYLAHKLTDGSHNPPRDSGSGIPMLSSQNVNYGFIDFGNPSRYVTDDEFLVENSRTKIETNDVLLTIVGTLGRAAVVQEHSPKFVLQRSVAVIKTGILPKYLCLQFGSPFCINYFEENGKGTAQKGIYLGQLAEMLITVPPLVEQQRIVAKVDAIIALCDQLSTGIQQASQQQQTLADVLVAKSLT